MSDLEQLLRDYIQCVEVENESRGEWFWLDRIEARIGRDRYRQIVSEQSKIETGNQAISAPLGGTPSEAP